MNPDLSFAAMPRQLILFGSPGTGKSHKVEAEIAPALHQPATIKTVFHPEYTYGDFMGRLMPLSEPDGRVSYRYYPGHFLQALAEALRRYHQAPAGTQARDVLLVIDEINRGNSAAIFGTVFQLLDRNDDGWSSYEVNISDMEQDALLKLMGVHRCARQPGRYEWDDEGGGRADLPELFKGNLAFVAERKIKLPPNLHLVGTMNTSDESIYYMDSAFKRRWSWEYMPLDGVPQSVPIETLEEADWRQFVNKLNAFLRRHTASIRKVEDKQIGYYFIRARDGKVAHSDIQHKLMFFLWDTVFARDKRPLEDLFGDNCKLVTFGEFSVRSAQFIAKISGSEAQ
ncbi:AAA family ATPase [Massilia sp. Root418]|jgi:5-methylcytosine-specific restriction endonuclease McrBC GTP-binding regulatory subunit McrB|uniref:AAA family ATPase n=1 Tax=Massilia sp. Root418 TaxID=1736532 RepID=UPI000A433DCC|nr:AAA family ATPase [Massilia sp. Root418]